MNKKVLFVSLIAAIGGLLFGYDTAVIAGAIGFLRDKFSLDAAEMGWAASSALVGCIIGCSVAGLTSDALGRKKTLLLTAIFFFISAIGSAVAGNLSEFVFYRMLGGVAVGPPGRSSRLRWSPSSVATSGSLGLQPTRSRAGIQSLCMTWILKDRCGRLKERARHRRCQALVAAEAAPTGSCPPMFLTRSRNASRCPNMRAR